MACTRYTEEKCRTTRKHRLDRSSVHYTFYQHSILTLIFKKKRVLKLHAITHWALVVGFGHAPWLEDTHCLPLKRGLDAPYTLFKNQMAVECCYKSNADLSKAKCIQKQQKWVWSIAIARGRAFELYWSKRQHTTPSNPQFEATAEEGVREERRWLQLRFGKWNCSSVPVTFPDCRIENFGQILTFTKMLYRSSFPCN